MSITNVALRTNDQALEFDNLIYVPNGSRFTLVIPKGHAWIDENGVIRLFSVDHSAGYKDSFKLHPIQGHGNQQLHNIDWIATTLSAWGISRVKGGFMKQMPNGQWKTIVDLAAFLVLIEGGAKMVKSFEHKLIYDQNVIMGYHHTKTGELTFGNVLRAY